ncbi:MAG: twin-arginine translocase subunit TatC [Gammaproteobacteria bacterium]|nr:twin-arginine translocase subunit TatC [Gammaproteobacteria bacterium]
MTDKNANIPDPGLSEGMKGFIVHLIELRDRLLRAVLAIIVLMVMLFPWASELFHAFATPVLNSLPEGQNMIATGAISPFFIPLKLAALAAVFIAMPYLLYQLWAFIAPGLYQHERRLAIPLIVSSSVLFYIGTGFAYFIVIPAVFHFMSMFAPEGVSFMPDIGNYLDFSLTLFFTFGLAFEVPVAVVLLSLIGVVTPDQLAEKRRYAILVAFIIGAIFTPPDILSQFMLAIPVWMLYELGILIARMMLRDKAKHAKEEEAEEQDLLPTAVTAATLPATAGDNDQPPAPKGEAAFRPLTADEMDDELARAEEEERRLNQGTSTPQDPGKNPTEHQEDEAPEATPPHLRDDRTTSLQDPDRKD